MLTPWPNITEQTNYFTGRHKEQRLFIKDLEYKYLAPIVINIFGIGGIGKSSLLKQYFRICADYKIPSIYYDIKPSVEPIAFLQNIRTRLGNDNKIIRNAFKQFDKLYCDLLKIHNKIIYFKNQGNYPLQETALLSLEDGAKESIKQGGAIGGAAIGGILGSSGGPLGTILGAGIGEMIGSFGSRAAREARTRSLIGVGLSVRATQFYIAANEKLRDAFVVGLTILVQKFGRFVLLLDNFDECEEELLNYLQALVSDRRLGGVVIVIAGREKLGITWEPFYPQIHTIKLLPFDEDESKQYLAKWGFHEVTLLRAMISATAGLPLALSIAAYLQTNEPIDKDSALNFYENAIGFQIVQYLLKEIHKISTRVVLNACSVLRWFDNDIVINISNLDEKLLISELDALRLSSLTYMDQNGKWHLHDTVRHFLEANLKQESEGLWRQLHNQAADYFRLKRISLIFWDSEWEALLIEEVYHRITVDENSIQIWNWLFGDITWHWQVGTCESVLRLLEKFVIKGVEAKKWLQFYKAQLNYIHGKWDEAESILVNLTKCGNPKLNAPAAVTLGLIYQYEGRIGESISIFDFAATIFRQHEHNGKGLTQVLADLSRVQLTISPSKAYMTAQEVINLTGENEKRPEFLLALGVQAMALNRLGKWDQALELGKFVTVAGENSNNLYLTAVGHYTMGRAYLYSGQWLKATTVFRASLDKLRKLGDAYHVGGQLQYLGLAYEYLGKTKEAIHYYKQAEIILRTCSAWHNLSRVLAQEARIFWFDNRRDKAEELLHKSYSVIQPSEEKNLILSTTYVSWGEVLLKSGEVEKAIQYFEDSLISLKGFEEPEIEIRCYIGLGFSFFQYGNCQKTLEYVNKASLLLENYPDHSFLAKTCVIAAGVYLTPDYYNQQAAEDLFYEALLHALRYNCFILHEISNLIVSNSEIQFKEIGSISVIKKLAKRWLLGKLDGACLTEIEVNLRKRENCTNNLTVIEMLSNCQ